MRLARIHALKLEALAVSSDIHAFAVGEGALKYEENFDQLVVDFIQRGSDEARRQWYESTDF